MQRWIGVAKLISIIIKMGSQRCYATFKSASPAWYCEELCLLGNSSWRLASAQDSYRWYRRPAGLYQTSDQGHVRLAYDWYLCISILLTLKGWFNARVNPAWVISCLRLNSSYTNYLFRAKMQPNLAESCTPSPVLRKMKLKYPDGDLHRAHCLDHGSQTGYANWPFNLKLHPLADCPARLTRDLILKNQIILGLAKKIGRSDL